MKKKLNRHFLLPKEKWLKSYWLMRNFIILFFVLNISVMANGLSQEVSMARYENASLIEVFEDLKAQTGFGVLYKESEVNLDIRVSLIQENSTVQEVLDVALKGTQLTYTVQDEVIVIYKAEEVAKPIKEAKQEKKELKGTVSDYEGNTLPGVSIVVKGTSVGVATDINGNYTIEFEGNNVVLVYSFVGMLSQEIVYNGQQIQNITLTADTEQMDEIVITGMVSREKSTMIGATSVISTEALESVGVTTLDGAIQGQLAGVYVRSSGRPGEVGEIQIRGINTMTGDQKPLYILDGMPLQSGSVSSGVSSLLTNGIGNIPPEDIESITILKDATAASIYGSRAANGVVVITTKVGKVGKDYINYSGKFGITFRPNLKWDFMNSDQKVDFEQSIYDDFSPDYGGRVVQLNNAFQSGLISQGEFDNEVNALRDVNTNWIEELYRPAFSQSHNITMSGGDAKTQYYASVNYEDTDGILKGNSYQKGGFSLKLSRYVTDKLLVRFNLYTTLKESVQPNSLIDPYEYAVFANPYEKPYNADGSYAYDQTYLDQSVDFQGSSGVDTNYKTFNILKEMKDNTLTNAYANIRGQLAVEYSFLENFKYRGQAAYEYTSTHNIDESVAGSYRSWKTNWLNSTTTAAAPNILPEQNQGFLEEYMGRTGSYVLRNSLEFNKKYGTHFLQLFVANEVEQSTNRRFNNYNPIYNATFGIAGAPLWEDINTETYTKLKLDRLGGTYFSQDRSVSFIGSAVYAYDNRYVLNLNARYDGVDILGSDNQFSPLWSMGLKWNAHNESFLKGNDVINRLVPSFGYGYRGSINRSVLPFHTYEASATIYGDVAKASSFNFGNPVLKWEKKRDINYGLELGLFGGRANFEARYFDEKTEDLLDNLVLPPSVGRSLAVVNVGTLSNKGYELSARVQPVKTRNWLIEIGANITKVTNKLTDVYDAELPSYIYGQYTKNIEGYPVNSWFGYKFSHVNPETGAAMVYAQKKSTSAVDGEEVYTDELIDLSQVSSSTLNSEYSTYHLGQRNPDIYGGFNLLARYKRFDLRANFTFASGNKLIKFNDKNQGPDGYADDITASRTNRLVESASRWRTFGDITDIPEYSRTTTSYHRYLVDSDLEDGSYLKLTNLSLGWNAPRNLLKGTFIKSLKASVMASNVFTLTEYSGSDPELLYTPFGYPNTSTVTFSINIGL